MLISIITSKLYRQPYIILAKEYSYHVCAISVNTLLNLCLETNKSRVKGKRITKAKMLQIHKYFAKSSMDECFSEII